MLSISLVAEEVFKIGGLAVTNSLLTTWVGIIFLILLIAGGIRKIKPAPRGLQLIFEAVYGYFLNLCESVLESKKAAFRAAPFITTIFLFVFVANIFEVIPGVGSVGFFRPAEGRETEKSIEKSQPAPAVIIEEIAFTPVPPRSAVALAASGEKNRDRDAVEPAGAGEKFVPLFRPGSADLNLTVALALISVIITQVVGFKTLGLKYLKKFFNFSNPINFFVGILELISEFAKIISFSFRLFGNIFAGEILLTVMLMLVPYFVPIPFYGLEIFVSVIQAFVFAMLTLVFIKLAMVPHDGGEHR